MAPDDQTKSPPHVPRLRAVRPARGRLDAVDRRILAELQADGRLSVNELAARVSVARATAYQRLQRLEDDGVIRRYAAVVDPARVGLGIAALILVNVDQGDWRDARRRLLELPGVQYLALTSGTFDFVVLVRVPDVETLRDVVLRAAARLARGPLHPDGVRARGPAAARTWCRLAEREGGQATAQAADREDSLRHSAG